MHYVDFLKCLCLKINEMCWDFFSRENLNPNVAWTKAAGINSIVEHIFESTALLKSGSNTNPIKYNHVYKTYTEENTFGAVCASELYCN